VSARNPVKCPICAKSNKVPARRCASPYPERILDLTPSQAQQLAVRRKRPFFAMPSNFTPKMRCFLQESEPLLLAELQDAVGPDMLISAKENPTIGLMNDFRETNTQYIEDCWCQGYGKRKTDRQTDRACPLPRPCFDVRSGPNLFHHPCHAKYVIAAV
jgi:hypothetical protein